MAATTPGHGCPSGSPKSTLPQIWAGVVVTSGISPRRQAGRGGHRHPCRDHLMKKAVATTPQAATTNRVESPAGP